MRGKGEMVMEGRRRVVHYEEADEIKKGPWKAEEDEVLINHVKKYGPRDWSSIRSKGLLQRTGKSCRLRWVNKLRPNLKNGVKFSAEEERTVIELQAQFGNKWAKIATYLSGRTDNDVKNFWSSRQKRLARILHTSVPSSSKSLKNTKEVKTTTSSIHFAPLEVPKFTLPAEKESMTNPKSSSSSNASNSPTIRMGLPVLMHTNRPNMFNYVHNPFPFNCTPEEKPFNSHFPFSSTPQMQQDLPLQLDSQDFITRFRDSDFLDVFGSPSGSALGNAALPTEALCFGSGTRPLGAVKTESHNSEGPEIYMDDFPPIEMFDLLEPLPSCPSDWSMD